MATYITHITLSTGHTTRSPRTGVTDDVVLTMQAWLAAGLANPTGGTPLPGPLGQQYSGTAWLHHGAMLCTVSSTAPLVTFGVAARSRHTGELWALMCAQYGTQGTLQPPAAPWCAVALHTGLLSDMSATAWLGDFERCTAWAWLERGV